MRVFLFKLFLRRINLINSKSESVQPVLSTLVYIALLNISLHVYVCICSQYTFIYTCVCLCTPLGLILRACWIAFWQPLNLYVQTLELGPWWIFSIADQSSAVKAWIIGKPSEDLSSSPSYSALEILYCCLWASFVLFIIVYLLINHNFAPLGDVIFMYIGSRSVITVYLYSSYWNVYYHCAFVLWFMPILMLSVYMWGYFHPACIRHSNVSVPAGLGCYRNCTKMIS